VAGATISASGVGKRFQLHHRRATSLKERLLLHRRASSEEFWALRDVDLEIGDGLTVGLIGPNGSGKSTLLKVLSGILAPTTGTVAVRGRVASLLELGAGFNGELTGRENIYLNAAILGLSRKETARQFDDIVAFSELEPFIDNQVKHYSSGQYVRLGFAVAVHVDPDILLVDEVLAVGDESFQRKCLTKIAEFQERGCTILFVTHALDLVPRICGRAVVLDHGRVLHDGDPVEATERLRTLLGTAADQSGGGAVLGADRPRFARIRLFDPTTGVHKGHFSTGEPLAVDFDVAAPAGSPPVSVRLAVTGPADVPLWVMDSDPLTFGPDAIVTVRFTVKELPPVKGIFAFAAALRDPGTKVTYDARRFPEAFLAAGDTATGIVDVAWNAEQVETPGEEERDRAAGDRRRSEL
jgi:ABC-2 type transport system ATP-binding protein